MAIAGVFTLDCVPGARMTGICLWWDMGPSKSFLTGPERGLPEMISVGR